MSIRKHPTKGPGWWQIVISRGHKSMAKIFKK
jgi:hypothetical protein